MSRKKDEKTKERPYRIKNLTGQKFGRLEVKKQSKRKGRYVMWECLCDCGKTHNVCGSSLKNGNTKSCGCLQKEQTSKRSKTHNMTGSPIYKIWSEMKARCNDKSRDSYKYYGQKGIGYCREWEKFEPFYEFAINNGYEEGLSIERKDIKLGYYPNNVTFIPLSEQPINRSQTVWLEHNGERRIAADWCRILGMPDSTLSRWYHSGVSIEDGLKRKPPKLFYNGERHSMGEWEKILGIPHQFISKWHKKGLNLKEIVEKRSAR